VVKFTKLGVNLVVGTYELIALAILFSASTCIVYTELFYAIVPTLFPYFLPFCYPNFSITSLLLFFLFTY